MSEKDAVRTQIIEAAKKRFSHFGYAKTTMAEVAADCAMSPGNLYRFFPGKLDIAEAIATQNYHSHLAHLRKVATNPKKSVRDRLRDFFFEELRSTFHKLENDPRVQEMAAVIGNERPEFSNWMLLQEREILVELLEEGNRLGEFASPKPPVCAEHIQSATMKFRYPQLWSKLPLNKLEEELQGVMDLVVDGLSPRKHEAAA
jgi:AcrR family transcriptional regulator